MGKPDPTYNFIVHSNMSLRIRQSLHKFLSLYQDEGYLWVDQICIDQSTVLERNYQVALISRIYAGASQVIAWLALENRASGTELLDSQYIFEERDVQLWRRRDLFHDILQDPYFSRLWIIQELYCARDVLIVIPDGRIPWTQILEAAAVIPDPEAYDYFTRLRNKQSRLVRLLDLLELFKSSKSILAYTNFVTSQSVL
jgi:hypothetical protein